DLRVLVGVPRSTGDSASMALTLNTASFVRSSSIQANRVRIQYALSPVSVSFSSEFTLNDGLFIFPGRRLSVIAAETDKNEGNFHWNFEDVAKSITCMLMSGPFLTGYTQTINDWYDREIDAINEPYRPIPSGAISENEVMAQIWVLLLGGLGLAGLLDVWAGHDFPIVFYLALGGSLLSYIYSAPPLKLKQNGWIGNCALGASYISLPWWAGQALFGTLAPDIVVLTLLYSIAGFGIGIVNDFKSVEGDRALGLQSLPVAFGAETAKWICVGAIDITQLSVAGYLWGAGKPYYALALLALIAPQVFFQFKYFLKDPVKYDVKYQVAIESEYAYILEFCSLASDCSYIFQVCQPTMLA
ncbi:Chlorophyll synthase, chloroplastic, partial [Cucurbita argyrosperma subsp. argyrosperma]